MSRANMNDDLGKYFLQAQKRLRRTHKMRPAFWPEYVTSTQPKVRRVIAEAKSANHVNSPVRSSVTGKYQSVTAQNIAKSQIAKSRRQGFPRKITPRVVAAWGSWGVGMSIFAASLLLNAPFPLGKSILNVVPGQARVGEITLATTKTELTPGSTFVVTANVSNTGDTLLYGAGVTLQYNHDMLELNKIDTSASVFRTTAESEVDPVRNKAIVVMKDAGKTIADKSTLALFQFTVKTAVANSAVSLSDQSFFLTQENTAARPQKTSALTLNLKQPENLPKSLNTQNKKTVVVMDGELSDWRDVITYTPASFKNQGVVIGEKNITEGVLNQARDAGGVFQVASDKNKLYIAFFADDDEITLQDKVGVKLGDTVYDVPIQSALKAPFTHNGLTARAAKIDGGYTLEISIDRTTILSKDSTSFNFEVLDVDSQNSGRLLLSAPEDSRLGL